LEDGLTEVQLLLVEDIFVEEDDTGAHGNPDTGRALSASVVASYGSSSFGRDSHNIEGGVDGALRRSRLLERRVDGGQNRLGQLRSLDLARGSFLLHCAKRGMSELRVGGIGGLDGDGPADKLDGAKGGKEWKTEGSKRNLGCAVGTSFDVCGVHKFQPP
jgi:hypothetical protein